MNTIKSFEQSIPLELIVVETAKPAALALEELEDESKALESIVEELSQRIFEFADSAPGRQYLSVHISPRFQNFGSVAQITVIRKILLADLDPDLDKLGKVGMDQCEFEKLLLRPSVLSARAGRSPQIFAFALDLGDHKVTGTITLYVGIKQQTIATKRCG